MFSSGWLTWAQRAQNVQKEIEEREVNVGRSNVGNDLPDQFGLFDAEKRVRVKVVSLDVSLGLVRARRDGELLLLLQQVDVLQDLHEMLQR